jgi:predicted CoA-binding protein
MSAIYTLDAPVAAQIVWVFVAGGGPEHHTNQSARSANQPVIVEVANTARRDIHAIHVIPRAKLAQRLVLEGALHATRVNIWMQVGILTMTIVKTATALVLHATEEELATAYRALLVKF